MATLKFIRLVLVVPLLLICKSLLAQTGLERKMSNLQKHAVEFPFEKAYLHLDKSYYGAGDTIWFKAYVVTGSRHELSGISNVLNIELVDDRDLVKQNIKVLMVNGLCQGGLPLPDSIKQGNYRVRAYTNWMRNAGEAYFFDRNVKIINAITVRDIKLADKASYKNAVATKLPATKIDVQFFPEGGNLVSGIDCRIAFKATSPNGTGIAVTGIVTDEQGNQLADLSSGKLGMGVFYLDAEAGKTYKAKITDANGVESVVQLPKAVNTGYVLSVAAAGPDHIRVIAQAAGTLNAKESTVTLIARCGGEIYYEGKSKPGNNSFTTTILKNKFPTGIVQFTLYSSSGEPLNERLQFVNNNDNLKIDISSKKLISLPRQKVKLNLTAKTNDNKPVKGSFSVSVIDETKVPADTINNDNILSNLLLTSDLKGYVENPGYYFASTNQQTVDDLDALMLTQGYRRFAWQPVAGNDEVPPVIYPADTGLNISGRLTRINGKPVIKEKVTLYTMDGGFFTLDTLTDNTGRFAFKNMIFPQGTNFVVQSDEKNREKCRISIEENKIKVISNRNISEVITNEQTDLHSFITNSKKLYDEEVKYDYNGKAKLLKEVVIKGRAKQPELKYSDNLNGPGRADYVFTAKDIASFNCGFLGTCLEGRIPGVIIDNDGWPHLQRLAKGFVPPPPMLVMLDGVAIDVLTYKSLSPRNIESIEFLNYMGTTTAYGGKGNSGVVVITSKRGVTDDDMTYTESLPGYKKFSPKGFYKVREFYSPQYDNPQTNKEIADLRTTIYWNPMVQTDKDGNASFEYFNAGSKGNYKVVVEGIDNDGNIGRFVYRYRVE